jgi:hypothetical protein
MDAIFKELRFLVRIECNFFTSRCGSTGPEALKNQSQSRWPELLKTIVSFLN